MKASILIATHNKANVLPNTLYSISRQVSDYDYEVCIVDDCSINPPENSDIKKFLTGQYKYLRLSENVGCSRSQCECMKIMDESSEIVVLQSAEIVWGNDTILQELCQNVEPGVFTMVEVRNVKVPVDLWTHWEDIDYFLHEDRLYETLKMINSDPRQPEMGKYSLKHTIFSGPRQPDPGRRWYFFLGAILKEDLMKTCFTRGDCFDVHLSNDLHRLGMQVKYVPGIAIHQKHPISL